MCVCVCVFRVFCPVHNNLSSLLALQTHTPLKIGLLLTDKRGYSFPVKANSSSCCLFSGEKNPFPWEAGVRFYHASKKLWLMMGNCWWDFLPWLHLWSTKRSNISSKSFVIILLSILIWNPFFFLMSSCPIYLTKVVS